MYSEVNSIFNWSEENTPKEKFIVISDTFTADGSFLLHHFINMHVKAKQRVCLVGLEQSYLHYFAISRKMGINLQTAHQSKNFFYVNGISSPYTWNMDISVPSDNPVTSALQAVSNSNPFSMDLQSDDPLSDLFNAIVAVESKSEEKSGMCIIIDNLSALLSVLSEDIVLSFIQRCQAYVENLDTTQPSTLVVLLHGDIDTQFSKKLLYRADLGMIVSGFKTGYNSHVDGQLSFMYESKNSTLVSLPILQYKTLDNGVKFHSVRVNT